MRLNHARCMLCHLSGYREYGSAFIEQHILFALSVSRCDYRDCAADARHNSGGFGAASHACSSTSIKTAD